MPSSRAWEGERDAPTGRQQDKCHVVLAESLSVATQIRTVSSFAAPYRVAPQRGTKGHKCSRSFKDLQHASCGFLCASTADGDAEGSDVAAGVEGAQGDCVLAGPEQPEIDRIDS